MNRNIQHVLDKFLSRFTQVTFPRFSIKQRSRDVLCDIMSPPLDGVKSHHAYRVGVCAAADIANDGLFVGFRFVGFDIGATKFTKVIERDVHGNILRLLVWS
jgi:hypothetical protein